MDRIMKNKKYRIRIINNVAREIEDRKCIVP
jgi:hypothetical protein